MCLQHHYLLTLLPLVATIVAQGQTTTIDSSANATANDEIAVTPAPNPDGADCDIWLGLLVSSDVDSSNGISESEYISFLSIIEDPPYVAEYFEDIPTFAELPWVFRVVHKSLACHCQQLGMGEGCCRGDDAAISLLGLPGGDVVVNNDGTTVAARDAAAEEEYRTLICQQIAYVLAESVPVPSTTTEVPLPGTTISPSLRATPTPAPSAVAPPSAITSNPSASSASAPSDVGPSTVTSNPASSPPTVTISETYGGAETDGTIIAGVESDKMEGDGRLGTGAIIGISLSILVCGVTLCIAARDRLRKLEGGEFPATDAGAPPPAAEDRGPRHADEAAAEDTRSEHSLWLDRDADEDNVSDVDDDSETKVTALSSLAAMGAASNVAANLIAPTTNSRR